VAGAAASVGGADSSAPLAPPVALPAAPPSVEFLLTSPVSPKKRSKKA
jgi:hypothetical protein